MKVETIRDHAIFIKNKLQEFLDKNKKINIKFITQSESPGFRNHNTDVTVCIFYEEILCK